MTLLGWYVMKLAVQVPWIVLLIGAVIRFRRNRRWANIVQIIGPALVLFYLVLDWVLYDPHFGMLRPTPMEVADGPMMVQRIMWFRPSLLGTGMLLFALGYYISSRSTDTAAGKDQIQGDPP